MKRFLLQLSFTDSGYIQTVSGWGKSVRYFIGFVILLTAGLASLSGFFAIHTVSENILLSLFIALFWGTLIMAFDCGIFLATSRYVVIIRIVLAIFIGFIVSIPLELKILEDQIGEKIAQKYVPKEQAIEQARSEYQVRVAELDQRRSVLSSELGRSKNEMTYELEGSDGRPSGPGPKYRTAKNEFDVASTELTIVENQLQNLRGEYDQNLVLLQQNLATTEQRTGNKLLSQYIALKELEATPGEIGTSTRQMSWALRLLFVIVELFPALLKFSIPRTDYDTFGQLIAGKNELIAKAIDVHIEQELDDLKNNPYFEPDPSFTERIKNKVQRNTI